MFCLILPGLLLQRVIISICLKICIAEECEFIITYFLVFQSLKESLLNHVEKINQETPPVIATQVCYNTMEMTVEIREKNDVVNIVHIAGS